MSPSTVTTPHHDYRLDPSPYRALHTEQGVFTTPPYSAELKGMWGFKDVAKARTSAGGAYAAFGRYRLVTLSNAPSWELIVMREISLGWTWRGSSSKWAGLDHSGTLSDREGANTRPNPPNPSTDEGQEESNGNGTGKVKVEIPRTGEVHDEEKLKGAGVFEEYLRKVWGDGVYVEKWEEWRQQQGSGDVNVPAGMQGDELTKQRNRRKRKQVNGAELAVKDEGADEEGGVKDETSSSIESQSKVEGTVGESVEKDDSTDLESRNKRPHR